MVLASWRSALRRHSSYALATTRTEADSVAIQAGALGVEPYRVDGCNNQSDDDHDGGEEGWI